MISKLRILAAFVVLMVSISTLSNASPYYVVDQHNDDLAPFQGYSSGGGIVGQSFRPTFEYLDYVELQVNAQNYTGSTSVHVDIMDTPTGAILGSSNTLVFTTNAITLGHFEFTSPINISSYDTLFISVVKDFVNPDAIYGYGVSAAGGNNIDSYEGGAAYSAYLGGYQNSDLWFRTGITATSTEELISALVERVINLNIHHGISNALDSKLDNVLQALEDANTKNDASAVNTLYAFIYSVEAQRGNKISDAEADDLITHAQAIIDSLVE